MKLTADGNGIRLAAPFSESVTHKTQAVVNSFDTCTSQIGIYCTDYGLWYDSVDEPYTETVTNEYGISGGIMRFAPAFTSTNTGATYWRAGIGRLPDYDYSCGSFFVPKTCHLPVYDVLEFPNNDARVFDTHSYNFFPMAATFVPGSSILFDFISPNRYDAEDIASAWFDSDSESSFGTTYTCDPRSADGCRVMSDVLIDNLPAAPVIGTPEPGSLVLVVTGLIATARFARGRRRRRPGAPAQRSPETVCSA
jgi:hypothetical protein